MSFDASERSATGSRPVELYEFVVGGVFYRFTNSEDAIELDGVAYQPAAIGRDRIMFGGTSHGSTVAVTLPADSEFAQRHSKIIPSLIARCTILRIQRGAPGEKAFLFRGTVQSVDFEQDARVAKVILQTDDAFGNRSLPRHRFGKQCNHVLYGPGCLVDPAPFRYTGTVSAILGNQIVVDGIGVVALPFKNGFVRPVGIDDVRMVIDQVDDALRLLAPFTDLAVNAQVVVQAGCDHLLDGHCTTVFDNGDRFGGYQFAPNRDIFRRGITA